MTEAIQLDPKLKAVVTQLVQETVYGAKLMDPDTAMAKLADERGDVPMATVSWLISFVTQELPTAKIIPGAQLLAFKYDLNIVT